MHAVGRYLQTGSSSPEIVKGLSESLAGRIAPVELWPFKTVELHDQPLPEIYSVITRKAVDLSEFAALKPEITLSQLYEQWLKGGYSETVSPH